MSSAFIGQVSCFHSLVCWVLEHCPIYGSPFVYVLGFKQFRGSSPQYARTFMPGRQRFHARLNAPVKRLGKVSGDAFTDL